ncbi:fatty acid desaturase family protein [Nitrosomonas ureae]|uniref:Fatty acid desaturase n=1 Tax=Nitrosomonas ureae TaxID=44577 RepID=A0A1H5TMJ9_9PROT|nr:fatty acid desaturase [Nitrosomonas ureae]SEF63996.1 Fatty acid desaturase [Nitrosomonas ureae]
MMSTIEKNWFRYEGSLRPTILALLYCQITYVGGAVLILSLNPVLMMIGTLAMAHGMVIAAYMIHECGHNSVFKSSRHNAWLGSALNWLTGGCYGTYDNLRANHMRHHVDHVDTVVFDYRSYLARHPMQLKIVKALEWLYIPAVELFMHAVLISAPFIFKEKADQRLRVTGIIVVRFSLFLAVFLYSPIVYVCYLLAYIIFLTVLRFMDALQHNYEFVVAADSNPDPVKHKDDRNYEQSHTFSNPISINRPWLNLLTLNFGYHNVHHAKPTVPWHELPKLHQMLYDNETIFVIPFRKQLLSFHNSRVARVIGDVSEMQGNRFARRLQKGSAVGADGISFLVPY